MSSSTTEENCENTCVVCFKNVEIYSIGECDHPVCYECSTRMRVLCRQTECPICRQDMPKVIFTKEIRPFKEINDNGIYLLDRKFKIHFSTNKLKQAYDSLLAHECLNCPEKITFQNFLLLKEHMRRNHELFYCDLCVNNLKILTCERRCYTRSELERHRRSGDPDDKSHKGHPLCKFCDKRYMDKDELCRHLRRDHLFCHFCDADGYNQYYSSYDSLRDHFRTEHYLCEEGACYEEKFTAVFRTDIDLKAHRASVHGRTIGKAATKQARTLELAFRLAPRPRVDYRHGRGSRNGRNNQNDEWEDQGAVGGIYEEEPMFYSSNRGSSAPINTNYTDEFPSLGGAVNSHVPSKPPASNLTIRAAVQSGRQIPMTDEDFPALGPEATVSFRVNSSSIRPQSSGAIPRSQPTNFSIHVNHNPSSLTTRVTSTNRGSAGNSNNFLNSNSNNSHVSKLKEDFPALGNSKMSKPVLQVASSQWSSGREPDSKVLLVKNKNTQPQLPQQATNKQNFSIEKDNFPQLSSRFESGCSVRPNAKIRPSLNHQSVPEKPKKATTLHVSVNASNNDHVNSNGNVSGDNEVMLKTGSKKKKKKNDKNPSGNNNNKIDDKNSQKKSKNDEVKNNCIENNSKKKNKKNDISNNQDNSSEGSSRSNSVISSNGVAERKKSELKIGNLVNNSEKKSNSNNNFCNINNNNNDSIFINNMSATAPGIVSKPPGFSELPLEKPPPGFENSVKKAPPGFAIKLNSVARPTSSNDMTFTNSTGQSFPIKPALQNQNIAHQNDYVAPLDFAPRNGKLVEMVMKALKDLTKFEEFRNVSLQFRINLLTASEYYNHCKQTMGSDFDEIFPELIVLLPDIKKQQELWNAHQLHSRCMDVPEESRLTVCRTCRQVLKSSDIEHHEGSHKLNNEFPLLNSGASSSWANNLGLSPNSKK